MLLQDSESSVHLSLRSIHLRICVCFRHRSLESQETRVCSSIYVAIKRSHSKERLRSHVTRLPLLPIYGTSGFSAPLLPRPPARVFVLNATLLTESNDRHRRPFPLQSLGQQLLSNRLLRIDTGHCVIQSSINTIIWTSVTRLSGPLGHDRLRA